MANKELLAAIDLEISRLTQARDLLQDVEESPRKRAGRPKAAEKSAGKPPAKSTEKKRVGRPAGSKRVLSTEARKRIADAQKKRWAAQKGAKS